jgi:acetate---CoA ligase (ADP-forming) subunit beta
MDFVAQALNENRRILSEYESKQVLAAYGIPVTKELPVKTEQELLTAVEEIGFPMVLKACSPDISHKTEMNMVRLDIRTTEEALEAFKDLSANLQGDYSILVQQMISGKRELMVGMTRDAQFGPCVMFGLGGIFTEVFKDVSFRMAPLEPRDAMEMASEIQGSKILGAVRGMEAADMEEMVKILIAVGKIGLDNPHVKEIDVNPLILSKGKPVAVDALIVLS